LISKHDFALVDSRNGSRINFGIKKEPNSALKSMEMLGNLLAGTASVTGGHRRFVRNFVYRKRAEITRDR